MIDPLGQVTINFTIPQNVFLCTIYADVPNGLPLWSLNGKHLACDYNVVESQTPNGSGGSNKSSSIDLPAVLTVALGVAVLLMLLIAAVFQV